MKTNDHRRMLREKFLITNSKQLEQKKERKILQEESWRQQQDFREVHETKIFLRWRELRKFQSSTFDTLARQLIEDQNTIIELSGRLQELQNEVYWLNDSKDFRDAESVRSGNSHVTSQPMLFPQHPPLERFFRPTFVSPRRTDGPPNIWDTNGISGTFLQIYKLPLQLLILKNWTLHGGKPLGSCFICLQRSRVEDQNTIKIWGASLDRQPKIQPSSVQETLERIMEQDQQRMQISEPLLAGR